LSKQVEAQAGNAWKGVNKRVDETDLSPEQSPDSSNTANYKGVSGLLGPRLGKTFVNDNGFIGRVVGLIPLELPQGQIWMTATSDGEIFTTDQPGSSLYMDSPNGYVINTTNDFNLTYPAVSASQTDNFTGGSTKDLSGSIYAKLLYQTAHMLGSPVASQDLVMDIRAGLIIDGNINWMGKVRTSEKLGNGLNGSQGVAFLAHSGTGTASGVAIEVELPDGWPASVTGGDYITIFYPGFG
jgi:hypothetical protein